MLYTGYKVLLDRYPVSYYEYSLSCFIVFHEYHYRSLKVSLLGQKRTRHDARSLDCLIQDFVFRPEN